MVEKHDLTGSAATTSRLPTKNHDSKQNSKQNSCKSSPNIKNRRENSNNHQKSQSPKPSIDNKSIHSSAKKQSGMKKPSSKSPEKILTRQFSPKKIETRKQEKANHKSTIQNKQDNSWDLSVKGIPFYAPDVSSFTTSEIFLNISTLTANLDKKALLNKSSEINSSRNTSVNICLNNEENEAADSEEKKAGTPVPYIRKKKESLSLEKDPIGLAEHSNFGTSQAKESFQNEIPDECSPTFNTAEVYEGHQVEERLPTVTERVQTESCVSKTDIASENQEISPENIEENSGNTEKYLENLEGAMKKIDLKLILVMKTE